MHVKKELTAITSLVFPNNIVTKMPMFINFQKTISTKSNYKVRFFQKEIFRLSYQLYVFK